MATAAVDEEEDMLKCSVCDISIYHCTLQCKHRFCPRCITDYIKAQADAVHIKKFPCPSCGKVTGVPDPSRPVDEWAWQLQQGRVVQEIMGRVNTMEDNPCLPCQQLEGTTPDKNQLEEQEYKSNILVELQTIRLSQLNTDTISVIDEIRDGTRKAVDLIKKREKQLLNQVEEITNRETNELKSKENLERTYRQNSEYIKHAVSSDSEVDVCDVYQVWKSGHLDICQDEDEALRGGNITSIRFSQQTQNITEVIDSIHLCEMVTLEQLCDRKIFSVLSESVYTRVEEDENDPHIYDVTVLEVDGVHTTVATDNNNKCLKSFYTRNNKTCHSRIQLDSEPWCITQLGDNKVMVSVPYSYQIVTVVVTPDLVHETSISTSRRYFSLAVMTPPRLAAGGFDYVDILNMQGEVMKSVITHNNMGLFKRAWYMCVSITGHLLVSDWWKETVTCLTSEGHTVWIYSGNGRGKLSEPRGITTTDRGDILVVDSKLQKVIQLSESGKYVRDVLTSQDGLIFPEGIYVDKRGSLHICDTDNLLKFVFIRK